jgi:hypothetical protein
MEEMKKKKFPIMGIMQTIILLGLLGLSGFLYYKYTGLEDELDRYKDTSNAAQIEEERVQETLDAIGLLMLLPEEVPTVATLVDVNGLKEENPTFYENAENGDILVIYTDKAILYRSTANMIINIAPVFIEPTESEAEASNNDIIEDEEN